MKTARQVGLVLSVLFFSLPSFYAEAQTSVVSGVSYSQKRSRFLDQLSLEYSNTFTGSSLANPISNQNYSDEAEDHQGSLELENAILTGYKFNSDVTLGAVTKWNAQSAASNGQAFELKDPYLRLSHGKLYSARNFNLAADLRLSAPVSEQSRNNGLMTSLASEQILTYEIPESRFTLGLTTFIQGNFHREEAHQDGDLLELHFSPGVEYKISDSVFANVVFETTKTQPRFADLTAQQQEGSLIEMGVAWDILKNLRFNPNLHTRTSRPLTAESITLGAKLNWVLL